MRRHTVSLSVAGALLAVTALLAGGVVTGARADVGTTPAATTPRVAASAPAASSTGTPDRPNIVFVLTDDLTKDLLRYMPQVRALQRAGTSFTNMTVTDSLCCPSRASIFTGRYPHNTGIVTNLGHNGGFQAFHDKGLEQVTFAKYLHDAGYRTAMLGKYLNFYDPRTPVDGRSPYVPPGWDEWMVAGDGYQQYDYDLTWNQSTIRHGRGASGYLTDVLGRNADQFIRQATADDRPFLVELSTFGPHAPATPAPADERSFPGIKAPRTPAWDAQVRNAPDWLADRSRLAPAEVAKIDERFRKRVQSVQSIDRVVGRLRATLRQTGQLRNTVVVFTSDNGFHTGQYRLTIGKETAFDTDLMVPLVVSGPGVARGVTVDDLVQTVDLAPTFLDLAGVEDREGMDGRSLVGRLRGDPAPPDWRTATLSEHTRPPRSPDDPDLALPGSGNPPTYEAMRTRRYTYVEYVTGERELYDRRTDPYQLTNIYDAPGGQAVPASSKRQLHDALAALVACRGATQCREAGLVPDIDMTGDPFELVD